MKPTDFSLSNATEYRSPLNAEISDRIRLARVIAIAGMILVHVPPGIPQWKLVIPLQFLFTEGIHTDLHTWFGLVKSFVIEGLGRTSACLLSVVAGYLAAISAANSAGTHATYITRRFYTIYLPMTFWSSLTLLLFAGMSVFVRPTFLDDGLANAGSPVLYLLNIVFFLTDSPHGATIQLAFLRDIFVCAVLLPIILYAIKKIARLFLLCLLVLYLLDINTIIILRPLILLCFSLGAWLAVQQICLSWVDARLRIWATLFLFSTVVLVLLKQDALDVFGVPMSSEVLQLTIDRFLYPLNRLCGSLFLWSVTARLASSGMGQFAIKLNPLLFVAYCSHVLVLGVIYALFWQPLFGGSSSAAYPVWFFSAPIVVLISAYLMLLISRKVLPVFYALISGKLRGSSTTHISHETLHALGTSNSKTVLGCLSQRSPGTP